ncbi:hypothetical protein LTS17_002973 [Exophiala oligosperma]
MESLPSLQRCFALSRPTQRIFSTSTSIRSMRRRRQQQQQPQQLPCSSSSRATRTLTTSSIRLGDRQQNRQSSPPQPEQSSNVSKTWKQMMESMKPMQPTTTTTSREGPGGASTATGNMSAFRGQKSQSRLLAGLNESIARHALDQDAMARELAMAGTSSIALRLKPSLGRTVDGVYGEPARAFRALEREERLDGTKEARATGPEEKGHAHAEVEKVVQGRLHRRMWQDQEDEEARVVGRADRFPRPFVR